MEFEDVPEHLRRYLPDQLEDVGGGRAAMPITAEMVQACRGAHPVIAEMTEKALALAQNLKANGADFDYTWAGILALTEHLDTMMPEHAPIMLAFLLTERVFSQPRKPDPQEDLGTLMGSAFHKNRSDD